MVEGAEDRHDTIRRIHKRDDALLAKLGYKSEFRRAFSVRFISHVLIPCSFQLCLNIVSPCTQSDLHFPSWEYARLFRPRSFSHWSLVRLQLP